MCQTYKNILNNTSTHVKEITEKYTHVQVPPYGSKHAIV